MCLHLLLSHNVCSLIEISRYFRSERNRSPLRNSPVDRASHGEGSFAREGNFEKTGLPTAPNSQGGKYLGEWCRGHCSGVRVLEIGCRIAWITGSGSVSRFLHPRPGRGCAREPARQTTSPALLPGSCAQWVRMVVELPALPSKNAAGGRAGYSPATFR